MTQGAQPGALTTCSGGMGMAVGEKFKRKGTPVYLWLIHLVVRQKPTQHCEAIILQFKKQNLFCLKTNMHEILTHNHGKVFNFSWKFPSSPFLNLNYHKEKNFFFYSLPFELKKKQNQKQLFNFLRHEISMLFPNSVEEVFYSGEYFQSLQNFKVKVKVAQWCLTLQEIFPTQGSNPGLLHYRWILY